ncbi:MAG TPA: hypothetical protein VGQ83_19210 [Polyangia bacterium]|jgi:hypothetical protein
MARLITVAPALALALASAGCGPPPAVAPAPPPPGAFAWRTMRAEHVTTVTARTRDGHTTSRRVRGVVAAARPDRLRLRALGPAGITLFDLVDRDGRCAVLGAAPGADARPGGVLDQVLHALCDDLRAAYRLAPGGRARITYGDWRPTGRSVEPYHIAIDDPAAGFRAEITVVRLTLDEELDPALFDLPPGR